MQRGVQTAHQEHSTWITIDPIAHGDPAAIQRQLSVLNALKDKGYQLQQECRNACYAAKCLNTVDPSLKPYICFHTSLPEVIAQWRPILTCFWRCTQNYKNIA